MPPNTFLADGEDLTAPWWWLDDDAELHEAPELRGEDPVLPGADGALDMDSDLSAPRRRYGAGGIGFSITVLGIDRATRRAPIDQDDTSAIDARVDELSRIFHRRQVALLRPATGRRAVAKRAPGPGSFTVIYQRTNPITAKVKVRMTIPGAFWYGPEVNMSTPAGGVPTGGTISLAALEGSDGPITDALVNLGAANNPRLVTATSFFWWQQVISAGRSLDVDVGRGEVSAGPGSAWTPPAVPPISYGPGPSWLEIDPTASLSATVQHTGGGNAFCSITARPRFLRP